MRDGKVYEVDLQYNTKVVDWLKQFHAQIKSDKKGITIRIPFSCQRDLQYAKSLLDLGE